ncbi:MAG: tRNA (adenosine(37)-N6)-threonylcarbamoyltransferase complex ATPase subunit type 1 TsaE [Candidatus Neomarinimicrobiota bacterium]
MTNRFITKSVEETKQLATEIAEKIAIGTVIALIGELGTGKTVFAQGFAKAFGINETVGSPTFKLISEYTGNDHLLYHIDCYRLNNAQEYINIGGEHYLSPKEGVTLIEWADIIEEILPKGTMVINLKRIIGNSNHREIIISSFK